MTDELKVMTLAMELKTSINLIKQWVSFDFIMLSSVIGGHPPKKSHSNSISLVNRRWPAGFLALETLLLLSVLVSSLTVISVWSKKQAYNTRISCQAKQLKWVSHHTHRATIDHWQTLRQQYQPPIDLNHSGILTLPPKTSLQNYKLNLLQNSNQQWQLWITPRNQPPLNLKSCLDLRAQVGKQAGCIVQDKEKNFIVSGWNNLWHTAWPTELDTPQINQLVIFQPIELSSLQDANTVLYRKSPVTAKSMAANNFSTDLNIEKNKINFKNEKYFSELSSQQSTLSNGKQLIDIKNNQGTSIQLKNDIFHHSKLAPQNISFYTRLLPGDNNNEKNFLQLHKFLFYYREYDNSKNRIFNRSLSWLTSKSKKDIKSRFEFRHPQITSQINPFWNKVPNFESSFIEQELQKFSDGICNEFIDTTNKHRALGRIFSIREKNNINNFKLFICALDGTGKKIEAHPWILHVNQHKADKINSNLTIELNLAGCSEESADSDDKKFLNFLQAILKHLIIIKQILERLPDSRDNLLNIIQVDIKELNIKKEYLEDYYDFLMNSSRKNIETELIKIDPMIVHQTIIDKSSSVKLEQFIDILQQYPDAIDSDLSLLLKNIFLNLSTDKKYECFFPIKNKIPKIIGLILPDKIDKHDTETAEEVLSLLIILSNKIVDTHNTLIAKRNFFKKFCRKILNFWCNKTHEKTNENLEELNQSISEFSSGNPEAPFNKFLPNLGDIILSDKKNLITDFISYYNDGSNSGNNVQLFKETRLRELIDHSKAVHAFRTGKTTPKTLNDSIYKIVNEHFRNSQVIKIKYLKDQVK